MEMLAGLVTIDAITFVVSLLAGERIGSYVGLAWRWYKRIKRIKSALNHEERHKLSRLEAALNAGPLTAKQKAALEAHELAVLTDENATLAN